MLPKKLIQLSLFIIVLLIQSSCAPVYVPNTYHSYLMDQKGDLHAAVYTGSNGADIQGGYAVSEHVGVVAAASFGTREDENSGDGSLDEDFHKHNYGEFGLSYFRPFGKIGRFEALGGFGFGTAETVNQYDFFGPEVVKATGRYNKIFVQSNVGLETGAFEAGVAFRIGQVIFNEFETSDETYGESEAGTFFEPGVFARVGWKNIKIESQLGLSGLLQDEVAFDYEPGILSIGLHLQFNTR